MLAATLAESVGSLLPAGVAVAISPIPVVAVIVILGTPNARTNGPAFAVAWILGLAFAATVVVIVTSGLGADDPSSAASTTASIARLVLGGLLVLLAVKQWRGRPTGSEPPSMPAWMASVDHFGAGRSFGTGILLSAVNPKNLILTASAAATIGQAGLSARDEALAIAVFVAIGSTSVVGAVVFYFVGGERSAGALESTKSFMATHNAAIMTAVLAVLGAKVLGDGIAGLSA